MATSHPISSRKAAEPTTADSDHDVLLRELTALRRSEAVLRDSLETSTIGLHWVGADGTILWANQAELDLLGYAREEYVGRNIAEFHADEPVINDMLTRLNRGETLRDHPARMRHRDGSIRHVLVNSSVLFEDGKFVHTRCFTRDVTALRQEQETNRLLAAIVDSSDDAIISEDLTGRITSWNRGAERIFGYTAQEAIGQSSIMLIPEDHLKEEVQIRVRLQRGEPVDHFETLRRRKDGKLLNISLTISPVRDQHGRLVGGSKIARDITEGKRAEEAINSLNRQQAADLAAMTRMQELSTCLIQPGAFSDLLNEILEAGIAITKADMGDIELVDTDREMRIAAHCGFESSFPEFLDKVLDGPFDYGAALPPGERVIIEDIANSPLGAGTPMLTVMLGAGARAMQSTPLVSRSGQMLGIFSTYYRQPRGPTERDLRLIDILVRLAADLIERSRAEEQLRESEERLRFAQDTANIGTFDWNIATGQNTWTTKLEIMYGLTPGGFLGTQPAWEALIHPEDRPRVLQRVTESLEAGAPMEVEWRVIWPDGSVHWLAGRWRVLKDAGGKPVRMMGVNIDVTDRKHMEEALRESEERLRLAIKATNDAIWDIDLKTGAVSWNDTYSALYGRPPETSDSWQWWIDRIHPEDRERTVGDLRAAIASGAFSWSCEYCFRRVDGEWAHIYDRAYIARDASGKAWRVIGAMQDLTDRKKAEAALAESEERFRNMADTAPVMIWMTSPDNRGTFFNKFCLEFNGHTLDMERGDGWIAGLHPEDREQLLRVIDTQRQFRSLVRIRRADGEYRWVLLTGIPRFDPDDVFGGYIGSGIDITDQKLIEERLRASEAHLMSAQRLAKLGSWERDDATGNTEFSEEMLRILGMPDNPPRTLAEFLNYVHPEDRERVWEGALRARSSGETGAGEYRIVRADSEVRFVRSVLEAIRNERGALIRVVGATQDITDFKRAQEESFARQKLESVGTLAGGIAHDFNNLLGGVHAQAELALAELDAGSSCKEELKVIREVAMRGSEIVRQLMIYAGKESKVIGRVDLSKIVEQMLALLKVSVSKHAAVIADLAQDLPAIPANPAQIRQIVMNLIMNASDAIGDRDGVIRVITRHATLRESAPASESLGGGDCLVLEVSDNGCGMSRETQDRVFDPFYTTKSAGHGLGLAVVSGIVRSLGGRIRIRSKPGKGSTFQVLLPCIESTGTPTTSSISAIEAPAGPFQDAVVLIVEDEDPLRQGIVKMLRKNGFRVLEAANGSAAINLLRANKGKIDLILLDMTIPGASSYEVVAEAAQSRPDAKVVLTSAYSEEILTPLMSASQIRGFIRKPFQFTDLTQILRNALLR